MSRGRGSHESENMNNLPSLFQHLEQGVKFWKSGCFVVLHLPTKFALENELHKLQMLDSFQKLIRLQSIVQMTKKQPRM